MQVEIGCLIQSRSDSIKNGLGGISDAVTDVWEIRNRFSYDEDSCKICLGRHFDG